MPSQTAAITTVVPPEDFRELNRIESFLAP
jgi:hypothetical protein